MIMEGMKVISAYSRQEAIMDGELINVSQIAKEAGFRTPIAVTRSVFQGYVVPDNRLVGQSETGRLWDLLNTLMFAIRMTPKKESLNVVKFYTVFEVYNENNPQYIKREEVKLKAICGPGDNLEPVITIMLESED